MGHQKSPKYFYLRQLSAIRKIRRRNEKLRQHNIRKNQRRISQLRSQKSTFNPYFRKIKNFDLNVGTDFSLLETPLSVINIINQIDANKKNESEIRRIKIDLSHIKRIDIGAITLLLGKVNEMSRFWNVEFWGNRPTEKSCDEFFTSSGFLDYMKDLSGRKFERRGENYIISIGSDKTLNEKVGKSIKNAMNFMTGDYVHYPPVFSIVQEMCSNSVEHANETHKNWLFGITHETNGSAKEIIFTMTDIGKGILNTLKRNYGKKIIETMSNKGDDAILRRAFEKQYQSNTEDINRNRGLPLILDRFEKGYIKQLKVLTNNVFLDFENSDTSKVLNKNLSGTFYYWKLDLNCVEKWNQLNTR